MPYAHLTMSLEECVSTRSILMRRPSTRTARYRLAVAAVGLCTAGGAGVLFSASADAAVGDFHGTVRAADGRAVAGAHVELDAFAVNRAGVHTATIETSTADASGGYSLPVPTSRQLASVASLEGGTINYQIVTTAVSGGVEEFADTTFPASTVAASGALTASGTLVPRVSGHAAGNMTLTLSPVHRSSGALMRVAAVQPHDCVNNSGHWNTVSTGTYSVITGEIHDYINMTAQYSYEQDASTTIGVALSTNGSGGPFSENGSVSTTNTSSSRVTSPTIGIHTAQYAYSTFVYAKQQWVEVCNGPTSTYQVVPQYWTGQTQFSGNLTQFDGNSSIFQNDVAHGNDGIDSFQPGWGFTKNTGSGADYGAGVSFAGIGLTSDTNYSSSVVYSWQMDTNTHNPHYLFGNLAYPAASGPVIIYSN